MIGKVWSIKLENTGLAHKAPTGLFALLDSVDRMLCWTVFLWDLGSGGSA
jgi:hypothetical protein